MPDEVADGGWDEIADWWIREHGEGTDREYAQQVVPEAVADLPPRSRLLDVGSGEGQVARRLTTAGHTVTGVEPANALVSHARASRGGPSYARALAEHLPFPDGAFDVAVACLVFEHVEALDTALGEVARVLCPGGTFRWVINHPIVQTPDSGWVEDHMVDPPESYWRLGPYLVESSTVEQITSGVDVRFIHRPLSRLLGAALRAGLELSAIREPAPLDPYPPSYPRVMSLTFIKPPRRATGTVGRNG